MRINYWDNTRLILILLVIFGHLIEPVRDEGTVVWVLYNFIYLFHMPAMLFIAGFFTRSIGSQKYNTSIISLLSVYVLWEVLIACLRYFLWDTSLPETFIVRPTFALWFLLSLATMKILLPYLLVLKRPLLVILLLALLVGITPLIDKTLSIARTVNFFPFFLAGYFFQSFKDSSLLANPNKKSKSLSYGAIFVIFTGYIFFAIQPGGPSWLPAHWTAGWRSYENLLNPEKLSYLSLFGVDLASAPSAIFFLNGALIHFLVLLTSFIVIFAIIIIAPRKEFWFTKYGQRTLYIYLLHIPFMWILKTNKVIEPFYEAYGLFSMILFVLAAVLFTLIAASKPSINIFKYFIEPNFQWLLKDRESKKIPT